MTVAAEPKWKSADGCAMAGRPPKPFSKLGPALEREKLKEEVAPNPVLDALLERWDRFVSMGPVANGFSDAATIRKGINRAIQVTARLKYKQTDVSDLSVALSAFQDIKDFGLLSAYFLNALIARGKDDAYTLNIRSYDVKPELLCFENEKNVRVIGSVGSAFCMAMKRGNVTLDGNVQGLFFARSMTGGSIEIAGMSGGPGYMPSMMPAGGQILVRGNSGFIHAVGDSHIRILGNAEGIRMADRRVLVEVEGDITFALEREYGTWGYLPVLGTIHVNGEFSLTNYGPARPLPDELRIYQRGKLVFGRDEA